VFVRVPVGADAAGMEARAACDTGAHGGRDGLVVVPFVGSPCVRGVLWAGRTGGGWGQQRAPTLLQPHFKGSLGVVQRKGCPHKGGSIPDHFRRSDQPVAILSPLSKQPSDPRKRQKGEGGTC